MDLLKIAQLGAKLPFNLLWSTTQKVHNYVSWQDERDEILGRARWLCNEVIVPPQQLLHKMPRELGRFYGGQWAIYTCCYTAVALANICHIYPDTQGQMFPLMEQIIDNINTPEIRYYDTMVWHEDAMDGINGPNDHMTYLSLLAWTITCYKLAGGPSPRFDNLLEACCQSLHRNMLVSPDLNLRSFPNTPIFLPDMLYTLVAFHNYELIYHNGIYSETFHQWMKKAQTQWINKKTGLLASTLTRQLRNPSSIMRGSYAALNCSLLALCADEPFARKQYELLKKHFVKHLPVYGIREYLNKSPMMAFDADAGPIILGLSPSGTAFALGAATLLGDWEARNRLLLTANIAGDTLTDAHNGTCHYRLGEFSICGEAVALGMRTMVRVKP